MTVHPATQLPAAAGAPHGDPQSAGAPADAMQNEPVTPAKARRARVLRHAKTAGAIDAVDEAGAAQSPDDF
jgi:hypothetical protein